MVSAIKNPIIHRSFLFNNRTGRALYREFAAKCLYSIIIVTSLLKRLPGMKILKTYPMATSGVYCVICWGSDVENGIHQKIYNCLAIWYRISTITIQKSILMFKIIL